MHDLKKVLLLGDSVRMNYQPLVEEMLKGTATVIAPKTNCSTAGLTLSLIDEWLEELGKPDIVHWNNGLHDVGHCNDNGWSPEQTPLDVYLDNIGKILGKIKATGARIIWATTTPVHPDRKGWEAAWMWTNAEIMQYNEAVLEMMHDEDIYINDLFSVVASDYDRFMCEDKLHLSEEGKKECAGYVVAAVKKFI